MQRKCAMNNENCALQCAMKKCNVQRNLNFAADYGLKTCQLEFTADYGLSSFPNLDEVLEKPQKKAVC